MNLPRFSKSTQLTSHFYPYKMYPIPCYGYAHITCTIYHCTVIVRAEIWRLPMIDHREISSFISITKSHRLINKHSMYSLTIQLTNLLIIVTRTFCFPLQIHDLRPSVRSYFPYFQQYWPKRTRKITQKTRPNFVTFNLF